LENKSISIIFSWVFLIVLWILHYFGEWNLFLPVILSFIILIFTASLAYTSETKSTDKDLSNEIKDLKTKIESTAKDIEEIKKIIEE